MSDDVRIDKWLWAARFFKTRSLATHAVDLGRVLQNKQKIKPAHGIKSGDLIEIHHADQVWEVEVLRKLEVRGSASVAQTMYRETQSSMEKRALAIEKRKFQPEPSAALAGRPTKRQRRQLDFTRN